MTQHEYHHRRPLNNEEPGGLQESDRDYVENNWDLVLELLEQRRRSLPPPPPICHRDHEADKKIYYSRLDDRNPKLKMDTKTWEFTPGTPAQEAVVKMIRRYPTLYKTRMSALCATFLGHGNNNWIKKGTMRFDGSDEKLQTSRDYAAHVLAYKSHHFSPISYYTAGAPAWSLPDNASDDWVLLLMEFFSDILNLNPALFEQQADSYTAAAYGRTNPHAKLELDRYMKDYRDTLKAVREAVVRYGWEPIIGRGLHHD